MITLYELKKLCNETYPEKPLTLVLLLIVWGTTSRKDELALLLKGTGLSIDGFVRTLMPYKDTNTEEDEELLTSCLLTVTEGPIHRKTVFIKILSGQASISLSLKKILKYIFQRKKESLPHMVLK
jgi:hypothetical protein